MYLKMYATTRYDLINPFTGDFTVTKAEGVVVLVLIDDLQLAVEFIQLLVMHSNSAVGRASYARF